MTLISGSRDRSICIKDIQNIEDVDNLSALPCTFINAHQVSSPYSIQVKPLPRIVTVIHISYYGKTHT
jgi:hypothetical protein